MPVEAGRAVLGFLSPPATTSAAVCIAPHKDWGQKELKASLNIGASSLY